MAVVDIPYYAIPCADGSFQLDGLPTGKHKIDVWQEKLGKKQRGTIKVTAEGTVEPIEVKWAPDERADGGRRRK